MASRTSGSTAPSSWPTPAGGRRSAPASTSSPPGSSPWPLPPAFPFQGEHAASASLGEICPAVPVAADASPDYRPELSAVVSASTAPRQRAPAAFAAPHYRLRQRLSRVARREGAFVDTPTYDRSQPSPTPAPPGGAAVADLGTLGWVDRTGGELSGAERRSLLGPLARTHATNAAGRLSMLARLNSGRRARIAPSRLVPPSSALTRAAVEQAQRRLTPALLNHSYRTFAFGAALGAPEGLT